MEFGIVPINGQMPIEPLPLKAIAWLGHILPPENAPAAYGIMGAICVLILFWNAPPKASR
jgi:hypothetical protein